AMPQIIALASLPNTSAIVFARCARRALGAPLVSMNPNGDFLALLSLALLGAETMRRMTRPTNWVTIHATSRMSTIRSGFANASTISEARSFAVTRNTVEHSHDR